VLAGSGEGGNLIVTGLVIKARGAKVFKDVVLVDRYVPRRVPEADPQESVIFVAVLPLHVGTSKGVVGKKRKEKKTYSPFLAPCVLLG